MVTPERFLQVIALLIVHSVAFAQTDIPLHAWRMHLSFNSIKSITSSAHHIYAASESGIMVFDNADNSLSTYTKLNGLSGSGISTIFYDEASGNLIVGYTDGNLDLIKDNAITTFDRLKTSVLISGSKKINHITTKSGLAYISTDFGVVVFDLGKSELRETWRSIGTAGATIKIQNSTFVGDSIFLATDAGVQAANINMNLLDFNNWKRFETGAFANDVVAVTSFNSKVYAAINGSGIYHRQAGSWTQEPFLQGLTFSFLNAGVNALLIGENSKLWTVNPNNVPTQIVDARITSVLFAHEDAQQKLWIGDERNGLISNVPGTFTSYLVNGPTTNSFFRLKYHNNTLYAISGESNSAGVSQANSPVINMFEAGTWSSESISVGDITDIEFDHSTRYISSFGYGVESKTTGGAVQIIDQTNSPLQRVTAPDGVFVTALERSEGVWMLNYRATSPLQRIRDGIYEEHPTATTLARFATDLKADLAGDLWLVVNPALGGGLIFVSTHGNQEHYFTETAGAGNLPSKYVRSIAVDRDGYVWIGTDEGVAYFYDSDDDAVKPIFENRFLLKDDKITAIEVDGGNRKWIGTERGVWLFNPTGEELIYNFTEENSPLLSNGIRDIEINPISGEVFFATDKGIVSYRADATSSTEQFGSVKIFPNPVTGDFSGTVSISGLATDAFVKVTDVSGKLIWQTQANGGTATWNVRDSNGNRAATGVYLVFAASADSSDSVVGKIVVIQ